ncbi:MAG: cardiolipin synthase [Chitinophagaceae bacterium]|nr:cardiolipin synthase [Chitinophagaceae bacterium]
MGWVIIASIVYIILLIGVCIRILFETHNTNKTLAYLLFCLFIPVIGMGFYLLFGINYWTKKRYNKKITGDEKMLRQLKKDIRDYDGVAVAADESVEQHTELAAMLIKDIGSPLTRNNTIKLLVNGEKKFPELLKALREASHHIHLEYYIYEYDEIGTQIIELLIEKAMQGVKVLFLYDDFGSPSIKKKTEERLRKAGAQVHPFHKVRFYLFANRINYRNHRKIVVIDGQTAFVGGINVADKYINNGKKSLYWRDTHVLIDGPAVYYLQYLFISDWNFCCPHTLKPGDLYFPPAAAIATEQDCFVQITASGPDSIQPSVLYSILQAIYLAKKEILIATPYFIPGDSIIDALSVAALSGLSVKLLVPGISDSKIVNAASKSNYNDLLKAGVEIYLYQKGFMHAKTMVTDGMFSMIGTANMDNRSFFLNFEVNALIYDKKVAGQMRKQFFEDMEDAKKIDKKEWLSRSLYRQLPEKLARLFSPVL